MIEYINKRLIDWATWCKRRDDGGLGYPGSANFVQLISTTSTASAGAITQDATEMEIDRIITRLRAERPHQYDVAYWVYLAGSLTISRVAEELHCCRDTVYTRMHLLHLHVMDELHEITIQADCRSSRKILLKVA